MKSIEKRIFIHTFIIGVILLVVLEIAFFGISSYQKESNINELYKKTDDIQAQIDNVFLGSITISDGYHSYITSNLDATKEDTEDFLTHLFTYDQNYIKNIALIKDTTILYNYPYEGNEASIGIDLSMIEVQSEQILKVKNELISLFVGPVELVQGGQAFILRIPILDGEDYWGQISVVIDADKFSESILSSAVTNELSVLITDDITLDNVYSYGKISNNSSISKSYVNKYLTWSISVSDYDTSFNVVLAILERLIALPIIIGICIIIYRTKILNNEISYNSTHDSLTGDYNRAKFLKDYKEKLFSGKLIAFTDVNKFKLINDTLGHSFGDWCLTQLSLKFRETGFFTTYRISGDEYILVSNNKMLITEFKEYFPSTKLHFYNHELQQDIDIDISIGLLESLSNDVTLESILMYLDYAMYDAKRENKGYTIVNKGLMKHYDETKIIEQQLIKDIKSNNLINYYQPIINMKTEKIEGFEVLSRWLYNGKIRPATMFINVVKKIKYVDLVDINLFKKLQTDYIELSSVCEEIKDFSFSVNLSAESLMIFERKNKMFDKLIESRIIPIDKVVFEISEDMNLGLISIETLRYIQNMGFSISVDDFGAGVSKLSDVLSGELKTIKTDKSLLPSLNSDSNKIKGFNTVIQAIQASGSLICVEGVETVSQLDLSIKAGCTLAQGYLFGKPMPKDQLIDFINNFNYSNYK